MNKKVRVVFFGLLAVTLLFAAAKPVLAGDIDDLLSKCEIAPAPEPSVMVYDYELSPDTLMPGDVGVLTVTLKNMQEKTVKKKISITTSYPNVNTETYYTMDAYIEEAYIDEKNFRIYNKYTSAGVIGPDKKVDLEFKIKAPAVEGIYMLKFTANIEDMSRKRIKGIRYFIPVMVTGTVNLIPVEITENEVRLEVINEGLSDVDCVYVTASDVTGAEIQQEKVYAGRISSGESAIVVFKVINAEEEASSAVFKAIFKHGINKHESNPVCVEIPYSDELFETQSETAFEPLPASQSQASSSSSTSSSNLPGYEVVLAFFGLLVSGLVCLFRRKS